MLHSQNRVEINRRYRAKHPETVKEASRRWRTANRDKARKASRRWAAANRERNKETAQRWRAENREKAAARQREWVAKNPAKMLAIDLRRFGMTPNQFNTLNQSQNGVCAICRNPPSNKRKRLDVDHCHDTGKIRGLLCSRCNTAIGLMRDSVATLVRAVNYLAQYSTI